MFSFGFLVAPISVRAFEALILENPTRTNSAPIADSAIVGFQHGIVAESRIRPSCNIEHDQTRPDLQAPWARFQKSNPKRKGKKSQLSQNKVATKKLTSAKTSRTNQTAATQKNRNRKDATPIFFGSPKPINGESSSIEEITES